LKVNDFGFGNVIEGYDGSGQLSTILGTQAYMAPELLEHKKYSGVAVDIFAVGIILFILISKGPPFTRADDAYYKLFSTNNEKFWQVHSKNKPKDFYSFEFKDLINAMLAKSPEDRPSIEQIKGHVWYLGETLTNDDFKEDFNKRRNSMKAVQTQANFHSYAQGVRGGNRDELDIDDDPLAGIVDFTVKRKTDIFEGLIKPGTHIQMESSIDKIFYLVCNIFNTSLKSVEFSPDTFKLTGTFENQNENGTSACKLTAKLYYLDDHSTIIEFQRKDGTVCTFIEAVENIKKHLTSS